MKTVILAGGLGTRLQEETGVKPKPMVDIGEYPILMHIMKLYAAQGESEFVVALGNKGEVILEYFLNHYYLRNGLTVDLKNGSIQTHTKSSDDITAHLVDTGLTTQTGGRLKRLSSWLDNGTFMMTYGDGLGAVDLRALQTFHERQGRLATVTAVRPPSRFGGLAFQGDVVTEFVEKPQIEEGWINGGFFIFNPGVLDYISGDTTVFEREPMERIAREGQLSAYRHDGFWQCMDTRRDLELLEHLWSNGAPWKVWT